ncbi:hypothetical protein, partial [Allofournierella massiliensis]|uniref:hypothetical protein n=1 Tax=Allofournierella massiliensis TaxID=1650663 RepID=UPI003566762B
MAQRLGQFVQENRYLTPDEQNQYIQWLSQQEMQEPPDIEPAADSDHPNSPPNPEEVRTCEIGDIVYLEDGNPFLIQDIGRHDIHLQDQSMPLFSRGISREEFARLLALDPRNAHLLAPPDDVTQGEPSAPGHMESSPSESDSPFVEQVMADAKALSEPRVYEPINYVAPYRPQLPGSPKEKYAANVAAIRTLKAIEQRVAKGGDPANSEEQTILAKYCGWGGLADAFDP